MKSLRVLHLEDDAKDAFLLKNAVERSGIEASWIVVMNEDEFNTALQRGTVDLILSDNGLLNFSGREALANARRHCPETPFVFVSGSADERQVMEGLDAGASDYVLKSHPWQLVAAIRRLTEKPPPVALESFTRQHRAMQRLVAAVQELSTARSLESIMAIVRRAARELTGADGATFILRDGDKCHYADEDAIEPLWKSQKFPMDACIGGWAMLNAQPAVIPDIFADDRVPHDQYRQTFVKSLVMVPIRLESPIGAIGAYWATPHLATADEVEVLQSLANTTAVAMENVQVSMELEKRVRDRTLQLEAANRELETFSYSVSHDLKAPLRHIEGYAELLVEEGAKKLGKTEQEYLDRVVKEAKHLRQLIDDLLTLARFTRSEPRRQKVDLSEMAEELIYRLKVSAPERKVNFQIQPGMSAEVDNSLMRVVLDNLLSNAWKYSSKREHATVEFGAQTDASGGLVYFVRDNGAGFDMRYATKLFGPFQRLHRPEDFAGTGIGLATVQRIIHRHGGRIWPEAATDKGTTFFFTLPETSR